MFLRALPFAISMTFIPISMMAMLQGSWWIVIGILYGFIAFPLFDMITGLNKENLDPHTDQRKLFYYKLITWIWVPIQLALIVLALYVAGQPGHFTTLEKWGAFFGLGLLTGAVGINYAHELMHQKSRFERFLSEILMSSTLYGHFCIEHVYGHHIHVATPKDPATSRYNENIFVFLPRTIIGSFVSAWSIQKSMMNRRGLSVWHYSNPFWRYFVMYGIFVSVAYALAGVMGILLFCFQAVVAFVLLEIINYVEHYGLVRKKLENGRYEHVQPFHSWNASHRMTNYFLINLQRHSDHHKHPQRRFPVLQHYEESEAPQLPLGYPTMVLISLIPPLWFYIMNPKVDAWKQRHYGA